MSCYERCTKVPEQVEPQANTAQDIIVTSGNSQQGVLQVPNPLRDLMSLVL